MPTRLITRLAGWFLLPFVVSTSSAAQAAADDNTLTLVYTGKLLGYTRIPDKQPRLGGRAGCAMPDPSGPDDLARRLMTKLKGTAGALIVGMGDNFSPELDARRFKEGELKDIYTWDPNAPNAGQWIHNGPVLAPMLPAIASGHTVIPTDNVACFFRLARYSALVPGKHDFYYGSDRLRAIARFLATPPVGERQIHMLAANLVIDTKDVKAAPRFTPEQKKQRTTPRYKTTYDKTKVDLPPVVLPWMREFTVQHAGELVDTATPNSQKVIAIDSVPSPGDVEVTAEFTYTSTRAEQTLLKAARYAVKSRIVSAWVCPGSDNNGTATNDPDDFKLPSDGADVCQKLEELRRPAKRSLLLNTVFRIPEGGDELKPDHNYGLCLELPPVTPQEGETVKTEYFCTPFTSHAPFFQYEHPPVPAPGQTIPPMPTQNNPDAYAWVQVARGEKIDHIAVFGVVDPDLPEHIGALNYSWTHEKIQKNYDTVIRTVDPKVAIQQLMQRCWIKPDCKDARKVLLAQMPPFKAAQLAGRLTGNWFNEGRAAAEQGRDWFDAIVSEADEGLATGTETRTKTVPPLRTTSHAPYPRDKDWMPTTSHPRSSFVVVPDGLHEVTGLPECKALDTAGKDRCIRVAVQTATITSKPATNGVTLKLRHESDETITRLKPEVGSGMTLLDAASKTLQTYVPALAGPPPVQLGAAETLQQLALHVMRKGMKEDRHNSDVALIQRRDLYAPEWHANQATDDRTLQSMLNRIFWKGDYTLEILTTGATLKDVLKKSAQYEARDTDSLSTEAETGRSLVYLGIRMDPETHEYLINGQRLEDARMYGVAVTDYVGLGDTGYPELVAKPPVPPDRLYDLQHFSRIATAVCVAIKSHVTALHDAICDSAEPGQVVKAEWQLDGSDQKPADTTPGFTDWEKFKDWFKVSAPKIHIAKLTAVEAAVQDRPVWNVILDSLQFGLIRSKRNLGATEAANIFAGVSNARAAADGYSTLTTGYQIRVVRQARRADLFANSDMKYAREITEKSKKNKQGTFQDIPETNQKANQLNAEVGAYWHWWPADKQIGGLKLLTSGRVEWQPFDVLTSLVRDIRVPTNRRTLAALRAGLRYDGDHRWIEGGVQGGELWHAVYAYQFNNDSCSATEAGRDPTGTAFVNLADCLTAKKVDSFTKLTPLDHNRPQGGLFLSAHAEMPLVNKLALILDNRAEFFFKARDDASVDTRKYENFIASLRVPMVGNLSLAPKVDWYLFTNKAQYKTITNTQFTVTVDYRFDWHQGVPWWRALRYPNPATALQ